MRFCDFFIEYKLEMRNIKSTIPWRELPFYRKLAIIFIFINGVIGLISYILRHERALLVFMSIFIITLVFVIVLDFKKENQRKMLDDHYIKYSQKRMENLLKILCKYNIDINNTETLNLLIVQAKESKIKYDPFLSLIRPLKILGTTIIPIITYVAHKFAETASISDLIFLSLKTIIIIICVFSIIISIAPTIKELLYRDYIHYDNLIYDINQVLIFYNKRINLNT